MTSWFLFLLCHGLICSVFMVLGLSIEKNPNSPLAKSLGFKSKLAQSNPDYWIEAQTLYGSLLKNGGAGLLITCFICMLCVLGQSELIVSIAGGILFALEVAFYFGLHWYCQYKLKESIANSSQEVEEVQQEKQKKETLSSKEVKKQAKPEVKKETKVTNQEPLMEEVVEEEGTLETGLKPPTLEEEGSSQKLDATRRLVFDPVPTLVKTQKLSRVQKSQEPSETIKPIVEKPISTTEPSETTLQGQEASMETLILDYKTQKPFASSLVNVQEEDQNGPSFHVLNPKADTQEEDKVVSMEPNLEDQELEEGIVSQQFFHHPVGRVPALKEEFIADTVIFHDPQEPQPIYHRASAQTKESIDIPSEFFEPAPDKSNCSLKRSQKANGSSNPIVPDPESAFRYRRLAASLRGETTKH